MDNELWQPSNGTIGEIFMADHCYKCAKFPHSPDAKNQCRIVLLSMAFSIEDKEYPREWCYVDGEPTCTAFKDRDEYNAERRLKRKPQSIKISADDMFAIEETK